MRSTRGRSERTAVWTAALIVTVGCAGDGGVTEPPPAPAILASAVAANPNNVLGAVVSARVLDADSAAVRYGLADAALDSVTPAVMALGDPAILPVLGLLPDTRYVLRLVAYGDGQAVEGESLTFDTGALPTDLPHYVASGSDPSPGYVAFAAGAYGLVIDNFGRVVWYRRFPNGAGLNFQVQPTARYVAHPPTPDPSDLEPWIELDQLGDVTRTFDCARGLRSRFHDLIAQPDGSYWIMCDETRTMDLSDMGGMAAARVTGTVVQHVSATGALLFEWNPFDHFAMTDLDAASRSGETVNWTHGNALDLDTEGNLLVSFRSLHEITKIDTRTSEVLWRMGGSRSDFAFVDAPSPPFARQHGVRVTGPRHLLLLDNSGDANESRAERYVYDVEVRAARLVGSYGSTPGAIAELGGTTQDLPGGRALVAFGNGGRVEEYDATGTVVWRIEGNPGYVFRAQRIESLYHPGVGSRR
jgi:hypothetical protein